ncbi:hypothetical protein TU84_15425 [Pseudomonas helleri]|uniref:hypothetical protein n=1 Tax=Pseudomonas helleri TaxID=1608996 RepID=UPI0006532C15|nr:hypothetical protein [Pseudomonas helleri]KMN08925.1 hypothetical protein TU84_15425 [Pseudomonas helleri]
MQTSKLQIEVDATGAIALIESMRADISALKDIPEFPIEKILRLGESLIAQLSVGAGCTAVVANDDRVIIQVVGVLEVFAAAVAALKLYVHAVSPQQL